MDIVKAFNSNELHTNIAIKGDYNNPIFRASDIGEILEMGNIRTSIINFDESEKVVHTMDTLGGLQQVTFLTEKGLYKVLFKSRKTIAEIFQNWVCEVIKEIRLKGVYDLQKVIIEKNNQLLDLEEKKNNELDQKLAQQKILEREKILLNEYATIGSIFYIIKVKTLENGQYIIKIGESRKGIVDRHKEHKSKYEECLLLDCFTVNKSKDFETFMKEHESVRGNRVQTLKGHETELELFMIGKNISYQTLLNIITHNIKYFNDNDIGRLELENEKLKLMTEIGNTKNFNPLIEELISTVQQLSVKIDNLEKINKNIVERVNSMQTKTTTNFNMPLMTLGPRLQKINPETLQLVKVYESVSECIRENNKLKRPSINKAVNENTIYHGVRWRLVDRELDPNIIISLEPTKEIKSQNIGYIAKLNRGKSEILNVYLDRKSASKSDGYTSSSALDNPVKNFSLTNGFYYTLYDSCTNELKDDFTEKINGEPILYKNGIGQYDVNNNLVREFICKYDCIKTMKLSDKTLRKSLENAQVYNGYNYRKIGSKLQCL